MFPSVLLSQKKKGLFIVAVYKTTMKHFSTDTLLLNGTQFHSMLMVLMVLR